MISRREEVRKLLRMSPEEIINLAGSHLIVCKDLKALHKHFANDIINEIQKNNAQRSPTRLMLPIGPTGQYPILAKLINKRKVVLKDCWFFFMDEYCDENGKALAIQHPLSFKRIAQEQFFNNLRKTTTLNLKQIIFPDESNIDAISKKIDEIGGIDICYGGIGIHGHVAFNEPEVGVSKTNPRKSKLNDYTITMNSIRTQIGGNIENFPKEAYTIGMRQILSAKKICLYCRNGTPYEWANAILRIALLGEIGDDYPVTYIRNHLNYSIITDRDTLNTPKIIL